MEREEGATKRGRPSSNEIEYIAYRLVGDEDVVIVTAGSQMELAELLNKQDYSIISRACRKNHRIKDGDGDIWYVFRGHEKVSYIQSVLERTI